AGSGVNGSGVGGLGVGGAGTGGLGVSGSGAAGLGLGAAGSGASGAGASGSGAGSRGAAGAPEPSWENATSYDEAARLFRRCRAVPWLRQVEAAVVAPSAGGAPAVVERQPAADALEGLASMERQVASLVMEGATNREIAARLFISVKTVEATLTRVYRKLGIRSRVDIVRLAAGRRAT
ncbi:MAG TPA: helix-turn-helix transcriptional regulator, partial [Streptomyces sp.]